MLVLLVAALASVAVAQTPLTWVTLGDWGSGNNDQKNVAQQLGLFAQRYNATFLVTTGDNFYFVGVNSIDDPQWENKWRKIYTSPSLNVRWYVSLGNHDHLGKDGQPQIDYSKSGKDQRWYLPNFYYTQTFSVSAAVKAEFIFIDTPMLCPSAYETSATEELDEMNAEPELYEVVKANAARYRGDPRADHLKWLNDTMKASTAGWRLAFGHYPVYSGGPHGNTREMLSDVLPIFKRYKLDSFICGHDHSLQHLSADGMEFYLSGGGAWKTTYKTTPQAKWGIADFGFTVHQLYPDYMITRYIDWHGAEIYSHRLNSKPK